MLCYILKGFWNKVSEMSHENTFHKMKMIRASSSKPPMMLPIRIQSEMGIARPLRTSSTVYDRTHEGRD